MSNKRPTFSTNNDVPNKKEQILPKKLRNNVQKAFLIHLEKRNLTIYPDFSFEGFSYSSDEFSDEFFDAIISSKRPSIYHFSMINNRYLNSIFSNTDILVIFHRNSIYIHLDPKKDIGRARQNIKVSSVVLLKLANIQELTICIKRKYERGQIEEIKKWIQICADLKSGFD